MSQYKITLSAHTLSIKQLYEPDKILLTDSFKENADLEQTMKDYLKERKKTSFKTDQHYIKVAGVKDLEQTSLDRTLWGMFISGTSGRNRSIVDSTSPDGDWLFEVESHHADTIPLYFMMAFPKRATRAIVILQRFGHEGVTDIFQKDFTTFFSQCYKDLRIEMKHLLPQEVLEEYMREGVVKQISFKRLGLPQNIEDKLGDRFPKDQVGEVSITIKPKRTGFFSVGQESVRKLTGTNNIKSAIEIPGFDYNSINVKISVNGVSRTLKFEGVDSSTMSNYDVTKDVKISKDGHPTNESIYDSLEKYLKICLKSIVSLP